MLDATRYETCICSGPECCVTSCQFNDAALVVQLGAGLFGRLACLSLVCLVDESSGRCAKWISVCVFAVRVAFSICLRDSSRVMPNGEKRNDVNDKSESG
jgi:hypothetical protein